MVHLPGTVSEFDFLSSLVLPHMGAFIMAVDRLGKYSQLGYQIERLMKYSWLILFGLNLPKVYKI